MFAAFFLASHTCFTVWFSPILCKCAKHWRWLCSIVVKELLFRNVSYFILSHRLSFSFTEKSHFHRNSLWSLFLSYHPCFLKVNVGLTTFLLTTSAFTSFGISYVRNCLLMALYNFPDVQCFHLFNLLSILFYEVCLLDIKILSLELVLDVLFFCVNYCDRSYLCFSHLFS